MSDWRDEAACQGMGCKPFFPGRKDDPDRALKVCWTCPVRDACLADAMATPRGEDFGIRGGTLEADRDNARSNRTYPKPRPPKMKPCRTCKQPFVPARKTHRFCCQKCYRADPANREKERERARRYMAANGQARVVKGRIYRQTNRERLNAQRREQYATDPTVREKRLRQAGVQQPGAMRPLQLGEAS